MGTLANSEDPDEMPQNAAFHLGKHYLLLKIFKQFSETEEHLYLELQTCDPSISCIMNHHRFITSNYRRNHRFR